MAPAQDFLAAHPIIWQLLVAGVVVRLIVIVVSALVDPDWEDG
jgi:hypothetical protein